MNRSCMYYMREEGALALTDLRWNVYRLARGGGITGLCASSARAMLNEKTRAPIECKSS